LETDDLQQQLKEVCIAVTHEALDSRLTARDIREYVKVLNSAAQISTGLSRRIERMGIEQARNDIWRFVAVAVRTIERVRQAVADRESNQESL
jgi:hypothetical protein